MTTDKLSTPKSLESSEFWKQAIADGEELLCGIENKGAREPLRCAISWFRKRLDWSLNTKRKEGVAVYSSTRSRSRPDRMQPCTLGKLCRHRQEAEVAT
jgi:predicted secreted Zn-dependent protease